MLPLDEDSDKADSVLINITKNDLKLSKLGVLVKRNQDHEFEGACDMVKGD